MKSVPITLFSYASESYDNAAASTISSLGYKFKIVKKSILACLFDPESEGVSIFLYGELTQKQDAVCSLLKNTIFPPSFISVARLGIFINENIGLKSYLINHYS